MAQLAVSLPEIDYAQVPTIKEVKEKTHDEIEVGLVGMALYNMVQTYPNLPRKYQEMLENPQTLTPRKFKVLAATAMEYGSEKERDSIAIGTSHFCRYNLSRY